MATARAKGLIFESWLMSRCVRQAGVSTLHAELYRDYCRDAGEAALKPQAFARAMAQAGLRVMKLESGQHRDGVRLKAAISPRVITAETTDEEIVGAAGASLREKVAAIMAANPLHRVPGVEEVNDGGIAPSATSLAPSVSPAVAGDPPPPAKPEEESAARDDGRYSLAPLVGGPATIGVIMVTPSEEDEVSAQVARELFAERRRHGRTESGKFHPYTHADDDALAPGELASMAAACAFGASVPPKYAGWFRVRKPGDGRSSEEYPLLHLMRQLWRRSMEDFRYGAPRDMLVWAGGLLIAAIETLDRKAARQAKEEERANG